MRSRSGLTPLVGVWFERRRRQRRLNFTQGALRGFYSAFYGTIKFLYAIWRIANILDVEKNPSPKMKQMGR